MTTEFAALAILLLFAVLVLLGLMYETWVRRSFVTRVPRRRDPAIGRDHHRAERRERLKQLQHLLQERRRQPESRHYQETTFAQLDEEGRS